VPKDRPVHKIRLGSVKACVWKNDSPTGPRFNTTFARLYKDEQEWKTTESFSRDDLLVLAKVADHAHSWISEQKVDTREGS
jgi:hypothetical protein